MLTGGDKEYGKHYTLMERTEVHQGLQLDTLSTSGDGTHSGHNRVGIGITFGLRELNARRSPDKRCKGER